MNHASHFVLLVVWCEMGGILANFRLPE
jgi:hypothetical protein